MAATNVTAKINVDLKEAGKNSIKEMLEKQLQLLSERSQKERDALTLCTLSEAMVKIASALAFYP